MNKTNTINKVYLFTTCLVNQFFPNVGISVINFFNKYGIEVIIPEDQTCCGQLAYTTGYWDDTRAVARKQLKLFPEDYPIVVPSSSCTAMMKNYYPKIFDGRKEYDEVIELSKRIYEFTDFLVNGMNIQLEDKGEPTTVTWHSSCKGRRELRLLDEPKILINQLSNVELSELEREWECCGFGGTFSMKNPEISAVIVRDKAIDAVHTKADVILGSDCSCLMNIDGVLKKMEIPILVQHLAEFLWDRVK